MGRAKAAFRRACSNLRADSAHNSSVSTGRGEQGVVGSAEAGEEWLRVAVRRRSQWVLDGCGSGMGLKKHRSPACDETDWLDGLRDEKRQKGPQCFIGFAVSAPMVAPLKAEMARLDESAWQIYRQDAEAVLEGAAVPYCPQEKGNPGRRPPCQTASDTQLAAGAPRRARAPSLKIPSAPPANSRSLLRTHDGPRRRPTVTADSGLS